MRGVLIARVTAPVRHLRRAGCTRNPADSILSLASTGTWNCRALENSSPQACVVDPVSGDEGETGDCRRRCRWYERPARVALAKMQLPRVPVIIRDPDSMHVCSRHRELFVSNKRHFLVGRHNRKENASDTKSLISKLQARQTQCFYNYIFVNFAETMQSILA